MRAGRWIAWGLTAPFLAVMALVWIDQLRWEPARGAIEDLREREERGSRELKDARAAAAGRPEAEVEVRRIEEELERLERVLPNHVAVGETTSRVRWIAEDLGIELRAIGEERRTVHEFYTEVRVSVAFFGGVDRLEAFEDAVAEARPLARVVAILRNREDAGTDAAEPPLWSVSVVAYQAEPDAPPTDPPTAVA